MNRNRLAALREEHAKNKVKRLEREKLHQEKMVKQRKDAVERRLTRQANHAALLEQHRLYRESNPAKNSQVAKEM